MKHSLYFVSSKQQSFWNKNIQALVNLDLQNLSNEDYQTVVLYKQGQFLKRPTARRYKIYKQLLFYLRESGEIGGFLVLKNVYCSFKNKDNQIFITLYHDQSQLVLYTGQKTEEVDKLIAELKLNCIQEFSQPSQYILKEKIGEGATSEVYRAYSANNQVFAIKKVKKAPLTNKMREKQSKSLAEEVFIMRSLNHPNIPKLYEVFESEEHVELVMTFYEGGSLYEKLQNYNLKQKQNLVRNILETMNYVHHQRILHRDLKPQNILYKNQDPQNTDIAIIDFGFSTDESYTEHVLYNCGTPMYAAPEVQEYKEKQKMYSTQCDVYSLGIIIYEIFYGLHPFKNTNSGSLTFNDKVKVPSSLKNLIIQMTRVIPKLRFTLEECLKSDFFRENLDPNSLDELQQYNLVDSIYQKSQNLSRKNSVEQSQKFEKNYKLESGKQKTVNSTVGFESKMLQKSINPYDQQLNEDLQFNEFHNCPNDFGLIVQKRK